MSMMSSIVSQFRKPHGIGGRIAGWIMAHRPSNRKRNFWTVDLLNVEAGHRVLEIGFGPGVALERVASQVTDVEVVGIDHSETMLHQASARNRRRIAAGSIRLAKAAVEQLPGDIGAFDRIYSVNAVQFWQDPPSLYSQLIARLKPGGVMATTYQPRHRGASAADADRMAERIASSMNTAGFDNVRTERLDLKPIPVVCVMGKRPESSELNERANSRELDAAA